MIKRIPLKVEYVDGTVERALCTGADSITFERTYDLGTDQVGKRLEYVWFLAWAALTRTGKVTQTFEEWLPTVEGVGDDEEAEGQTEIRPLEKAVPISPSPTLPTSSDLLLQ
jgi:hypothetical protein